uniref:Uncharacterized protein n=1 Tax=viral metagenome TaxID=1070528 RepID=A0A6C0LD36_9ZZZZ
MFNKIIKTIRDRLLNNPRKSENLTRMQEIALSIREQGTNQKEGRVNPLTKKGLNALVSVLSTEDKIQGLSKSNSGSFSSRSQISRSQGSFSSRSQISRSQGSISSIQSVSLREIESRNDAIIEKLNFMTFKILIAISSLAGNTLYLNNTIITSASFISIFQITLFIFFNCINKIESMRDNESMTEIDVGRILSINNDNNPDMIGGAGYDKKFLLKTINLLINAKSIRYRNAIIYLFACIFVFVLLKKYSEKYDGKINISGSKTKKPRMRRNA